MIRKVAMLTAILLAPVLAGYAQSPPLGQTAPRTTVSRTITVDPETLYHKVWGLIKEEFYERSSKAMVIRSRKFPVQCAAEKNVGWFKRNPDAYWYRSVFGDG